jgi:hypothetical protein
MDPVSSPASAISTSKMSIMVAKRRVPCESRALPPQGGRNAFSASQGGSPSPDPRRRIEAGQQG